MLYMKDWIEKISILKNNNWTLTECCAGGDWERDDKNIDIASDVDIPNNNININIITLN